MLNSARVEKIEKSKKENDQAVKPPTMPNPISKMSVTK